MYNLINLSDEELQEYNDLITERIYSYGNNPNNQYVRELDAAIEKFGISAEDAISVGAIDSVFYLDDKIKSNNEALNKQRDDLLNRLSEYDETDPEYKSEGAQEILKRLANIYKYTNTDMWITDSINEVLESTDFENIAKSINTRLENGEKITYEKLIFDDSYNGLIKEKSQKLYNATDDENLKNAASCLANYLMTTVEEELNNTPKLSFANAFNSPDFSSAKEELLELASAGELTPETLSSTEEYKTLLSQTRLRAEDACENINKVVTAAQRLNYTTSGLSSLTDVYEQANENGFADIESLYKLDDAFKNLDSYDEFVRIVGSGTHSMEEMQQSFNRLTSEYLEHTKVMDGLSKSNEELYIQQLKSYGIANAQEIVSRKLSQIDYSDAINSYFNANKGSEGWCNSQQKLNNLLKNETN